jgi:hypothetical protein
MNQDDLNAAARGLNMVGMSIADLKATVVEFDGKTAFAARVIVAAARQMIAAKRQVGAE